MKSALAEKVFKIIGYHFTFTVSIQGPLAIAFDVEDDFYDYKGGIFRSDSCSEALEALDHAMLAVGYGEEDGKFYIYNETRGTGSPSLLYS